MWAGSTGARPRCARHSSTSCRRRAFPLPSATRVGRKCPLAADSSRRSRRNIARTNGAGTRGYNRGRWPARRLEGRFVVTRIAAVTFSALLALSGSARAEDAAPVASAQSAHPVVHGGVVVAGSTGSPLGDVFLNLLTLGVFATALNEHIEARQDIVVE